MNPSQTPKKISEDPLRLILFKKNIEKQSQMENANNKLQIRIIEAKSCANEKLENSSTPIVNLNCKPDLLKEFCKKEYERIKPKLTRKNREDKPKPEPIPDLLKEFCKKECERKNNKTKRLISYYDQFVFSYFNT